ncbi:TonB-dependent receptor [uncultured Algibacter sp.]|uniref:SusC/RagA family TonB-linked outer membrane protein n=1 Tax=uncultured Algibacter sp. TaxID=298659 RepID=UPI00321670B6
MRTLIFLLCLSVFSATPNNVLSQNVKIKIDENKQATVDEVFDLIMSQTDYTFIYQVDMFKNFPKVNLEKGIIKASELLKRSLSNGQFDLNLTANKTIVIKEAVSVNQQEVTITGTVTDINGIPLAGVLVTLGDNDKEGFYKTGVATGFDGKYSLTYKQKTNETARIYTRMYGFKTVFENVNGRTTIDFVLEEDISNLEEVVIVGYGSTVRKDLTGSVGSIKSEQVTQVQSQTVDQALVGQLSGVFVESNAGAPGAGASVNIRGLSQIIGDNQPLYVVDGVPIQVNPNFGPNASAGNRENPLLAIDPNNIERVDVLKDASSAAIYGSRAANGVILITTKKGKRNQAPQFNFSTNATFQNPTQKEDYLNAEQYKTFATEQAQIILDGLPDRFQPLFTVPFAIVNDPDNFFGDANTDWQDEILNKNALWNQYNFSVNGGSEKTNYFASASINQQDGLLIGNKFKKYNLSANFDSQIKDNFKIGASINYTYGKNNQSGLLSLNNGNFRPDLGVFDADGNPTEVQSSNGFRGRTFINPVENLGKVSDQAISQNVLASVYGELRLVKNLKLKSQINVGLNNDKSSIFNPSFTSTALIEGRRRGFEGDAFRANQTTDGYTTSFSNTLNYNVTFNDDHRLDVVAGLAWDRVYLNLETQNYSNFPDDFELIDIGSATNLYDFGSATSETGLNSIFGRLNYNYKDRYLVTFTARNDTSAKFGPNNRRGFFPSAGFGWNIHNEDFFNNESFVNQLKLRASLGRTGNDNIEAFSYQPFYTTLGIGSFYNGVNGISVQDLPNPDIQWEETDQLDLGLEFGLLNGRINGEVVYFEKNTDELILITSVPHETGFQSFFGNVADVSNKGWEFNIGADVIRTKDFTWNSNFNISFIKNNVDALNGGTNENNPFLPARNGIQEGEPIGFILGYDVVGIAQTPDEIDALNTAAPSGNYFSGLRAPGDYIFRDIDGDGEITDNDRKNLGDINPDYFGGWNNTITYKNFDLSFNFQFVQGNSRDWVIPSRFDEPRIDLSFNQPIQVLDTWSADNTSATYARLGSSTHNPTGGATSKDVQDGSYTRLRYLGLGYNLPQKLVNTIGFNTARITLSGNNLFTITNYPGQDPENVTVAQGGSSISRRTDGGFAYPQARTFTFGVQLSF